MEHYYAKDVERITGVQRLRLHHWMKEGFFIPSGEVKKGHGNKNIYTIEDLYKIALLKKTIENGLHGWAAGQLLCYDLMLLRGIHQSMKTDKLTDKSLSLCVLMRFSKEREIEVEILDNLGDIYPQNNIEPMSISISKAFAKSGYDEAVIVNLSKLFDEVDLRA